MGLHEGNGSAYIPFGSANAGRHLWIGSDDGQDKEGIGQEARCLGKKSEQR